MAGKSHTIQLISKNVLTLDELELYELCQLAGISMEPQTFKIILDLLKMNVSPQAVLHVLKTMCAGKRSLQRGASESLSSSGRSFDTENIPPAPQQRSAPKIRHPSASRRTESKR